MNEVVQITANSHCTAERVEGKAEHVTCGTFQFKVGLSPEADPICMDGGRIRFLRIERNGMMRYLFANGSRRLIVFAPGLGSVIAELKSHFNGSTQEAK